MARKPAAASPARNVALVKVVVLAIAALAIFLGSILSSPDVALTPEQRAYVQAAIDVLKALGPLVEAAGG